jgi:tRNA threonylcarbamoyladenosine biosynthesis protein TsaB
MNCLAIDTSSDFLSLALCLAGKTEVLHEPAGQAHAERALPAVRRLLDAAGAGLKDLDVVVFGQGPGSFTGLRIACGLAQGLAYAAGLPVIAIPTLDCVAAQAQGRVLVCLDARMHQVYTAAYDTGDWQRLAPMSLCNPDEVILPDSAGGWIGAGSGFAVYHETLAEQLAPGLAAIETGIRPRADTLIRLAETGRYASTHPRDAGLLYIRDKVALTSIEQQAQRK